ncbi:UNVERIFIED_CONTAM: hypothetical protein K2H54_063006, partial [Gekko kuhli]
FCFSNLIPDPQWKKPEIWFPKTPKKERDQQDFSFPKLIPCLQWEEIHLSEIQKKAGLQRLKVPRIHLRENHNSSCWKKNSREETVE